MKLRFIDRLSDVSQQDWDSLRRSTYPFLSFAFLNALEESGCVGGDSGWTPRHVIGEQDGDLVLALPLYLKVHSNGEYVFDWQWANAYAAHGRRYFPKLVSAVPFTPVSGPRLLTRKAIDKATLDQLVGFITSYAQENAFSGWHLLFPQEEPSLFLSDPQKMMQREDVQFHWFNQNYDSFDSFLASFRSSKRKQIRRERRKVAEQGVQILQKTGDQLSLSDWRDFYQCYKATYYKRSGHAGYLNWAFFEQIASDLGEQIMIALAYIDQQLVASSLFFMDDSALYGRYWGALTEVDCLHFEACYYQGIDFAIAQGLQRFNPGTQGEHKLVRGFEPIKTSSLHWISDPDFAEAIGQYLDQEKRYTSNYEKAAEQHLPFRKDIS